MRFREIQKLINEAPLEVPSTPQDFKKWLTRELSNKGISTTESNRGGFHIRFPLDGTVEDFQDFFRDAGIEVHDTNHSASGKFQSYELVLVNSNEELTAPINLIWVNNIAGGSQSDKNFRDKELTPDDLGLGGQVFNNTEELTTVLSAKINEKYPQHTKMLMWLASKSAIADSDVVLLNGVDLAPYHADLATISKNYGEILAGLWFFNNMGYELVDYPAVSNAALVDFYGSIDGVEQPVSIKSGGGSKVTINNIVDALSDKVKAGKVNLEEEKAYDVFQIVRNYDMQNLFVELHKHFNSKAINELSKIVDIPKDQLNATVLYEWIRDKDVEEAKKLLLPWHNSIGKNIEEKTWDVLTIDKKKEKLWPIISPLGEWMTTYLNSREDMLESLSNLAKMLQVVQLNIDVKTMKMYFKVNNFGDAEFKFGWAGYKGGNKLGFEMKKR